MAKFSTAILGVALLLVIPAHAHAAKWYQVEVIIFTQQDSYGNESAPRDIDLHYPSPATHFGEGNFIPLPKEQRQLNADASTLSRTGVYKVLFHEAWRQAGRSQRQTPWLLVRGGKQISDRYQLEGGLRLYLSSYLHLVTNLWLLQPADAYSSPSATTSTYFSTRDLPPLPGRSRSGALSGGSAHPAVALEDIYTFEQSDRLQLGEIHYLDHPKMGILIKVTRAQTPGVNTSAEAASIEATSNQ